MSQQLWIASLLPLDAELLQPVKNGDFPKPKPAGGGLWTSTYLEQHGSRWVQWCLEEQYGRGRSDDGSFAECWLLDPRPDARIFTICCYADLHNLVGRYPNSEQRSYGAIAYPDWEAIACDYDGVRLTEMGQWDTRLSDPFDLYTWDCESTLWFRWAFDHAELLGERVFDLAVDDDEVAA